ncbi:MAG TPA: DUF885 domain-containing protein [Thermoanaerobaculia bacterium]|nr:DUF885 domain-containing protein [Thermoanaerobaculia bacterium]
MTRRPISGLALCLGIALVACAPEHRRQDGERVAPGNEVVAIADEYFDAWLATFPEAGTSNGIRGANHAGVTDNSLDALARWQARQDAWLERLEAIDLEPIAGSDAAITAGILLETLRAWRQRRVCRFELWGVDSYAVGWQNTTTDLATIQPVGTPELREAALARARGLVGYVDTEIANLRAGLLQGLSAPRVIVESVVRQLDDLLATSLADSPFTSPARRDGDPAFREALLAAVGDELLPAVRRYREFLADEYVPAARESLGVSAHPDGLDCYRATVRFYSTLDLDADQVFATGESEMAKIVAQMRAIGERSFDTDEVAALLTRARTDPALAFASEQAVIDLAQAAIERIRPEVPEWFGIVPDAEVIIEPYPEFRQKAGAPGQYRAAPEDGSRPGIFNINPSSPRTRPRAGVEAITFHETYPGHHLQISIAAERTSAHPLRRFSYNSGFGEGWGLYAERLADEMGAYGTELDRLGLLSSEAWRAARLVIDAGIHTRGWTREQAVDYLRSHTTVAPREIEGEVDRYISWPGQGGSYMLGRLEILRLRERAREGLGDGFDIRAFHDRVLEDGSVTLPMLAAKIERWIASERAGG